MSFCDDVTNPMDNTDFLKSMIELYAEQNTQNRKSGSYIYDAVIQHPKSEAHEDKNLYLEKYRQYVKSDTIQKLLQEVFNFSKADAEKIYEEIFELGEEESKTMQMSAEEVERMLEKHGCISMMYGGQYQNMTAKELFEEVFSGHGSMGYHVYESRLGKPFSFPADTVKLYINAGADTYEFSKLFREQCEEQGISYMYKVANPEKDEHTRADKLCIYSGLDDIEKYSKIVKKIKLEHPEFDYRNPAPIMGSIDGWIGVGADPDNFELANSYSDSRALLLENSLGAVLGNTSKKKIRNILSKSPDELVNQLKAEISKRAERYAITKHFVFDDVIVQAFEQENPENREVFYHEHRAALFPTVVEHEESRKTFWQKIKGFIKTHMKKKNQETSRDFGPMPEVQLTYEENLSQEEQFRQSVHVEIKDMPTTQTTIRESQLSRDDAEDTERRTQNQDDGFENDDSDIWL